MYVSGGAIHGVLHGGVGVNKQESIMAYFYAVVSIIRHYKYYEA
jgi:hypothetical protein